MPRTVGLLLRRWTAADREPFAALNTGRDRRRVAEPALMNAYVTGEEA
jgi:hypothetical protein